MGNCPGLFCLTLRKFVNTVNPEILNILEFVFNVKQCDGQNTFMPNKFNKFIINLQYSNNSVVQRDYQIWQSLESAHTIQITHSLVVKIQLKGFTVKQISFST